MHTAAGSLGRRRVDVTCDDALGTSDATDLVARLARREISPGELRAAALDRCQRADAVLDAVADWFPEPLDTEVAVGVDSPLAGIPALLKDCEAVTGRVTSHGSWAVGERPAARCSPMAGHLLRLGLGLLGATTLPEFGMTASTESDRLGATRNPWDTTRTPGGSSGGSAAMVAAGAVPIAHGTDGGGSIRIPAACCGLVGLKPSRGRLPEGRPAGGTPLRLATAGVLTRSVRDTALFLALSERASPAVGLPPIGHVTRPGRARLRIGLCLTATRGMPITAEAAGAASAAADLCSRLGHDVELTGPPVGDRFLVDFLRYWSFLAWRISVRGRAWFGPGFDRRQLGTFMRGLRSRMVDHVELLPGSVSRLRRLAAEHEPDLRRFDVLVSPSTGHEAPGIGFLGPHVAFPTHLARLVRFASPTPSVQNVSGSPAVSLPLGRTSGGLPLGVQLVAPFGQERMLLQLALALEEAAPWPGTPATGAPAPPLPPPGAPGVMP